MGWDQCHALVASDLGTSTVQVARPHGGSVDGSGGVELAAAGSGGALLKGRGLNGGHIVGDGKGRNTREQGHEGQDGGEETHDGGMRQRIASNWRQTTGSGLDWRT